MDRRKMNIVGVIGTGMVGATFAYALMQHGVANELVLIDADARRAEGEMMDLNHGLPFVRPMRIVTGDFSDLVDQMWCDLCWHQPTPRSDAVGAVADECRYISRYRAQNHGCQPGCDPGRRQQSGGYPDSHCRAGRWL
jgi:hypothetical protein